MSAIAGRTVGLYWNDVLVAGVREKGLSLSGEPIDITNDDSDGWRQLLDAAGVNGAELSVSGVCVNDTLRADWFSGASSIGQRMQTLELRFPDNGEVSGTFYLQDYSETGAHDDAVTFEATFVSSGTITYTPG